MSQTNLERFTAACSYPGVVNVIAVESHLARYVTALGVDRSIVRLEAGWTLSDHPSLARYVDWVLKDFAKRNPPAARDAGDARDARDARAARDAGDARDARDARAARAARDAGDARDARDARAARDALDALDARAARDALDARAALDAGDARDALDALDARDALTSLHRFAQWCVQAWNWGWWRFELSWIATTYLGALQNKSVKVQAWSEPLFEAFIAGAWLLHWTDDTLYWVAKPTVHRDTTTTVRRLHNASGPALESDCENLYYWHGVLVPAFVVTRPDWITIKHIENEENAEVRRVMMERYGYPRYLKDSGATVVHSLPTDFKMVGLRDAKLLRKDVPNDEPIMYVDLLNSTPEPDGTTKRYMLRVDPNAYGGKAAHDCLAAVASTWRNKDGGLTFKKPADYHPVFES